MCLVLRDLAFDGIIERADAEEAQMFINKKLGKYIFLYDMLRDKAKIKEEHLHIAAVAFYERLISDLEQRGL